MGNGWDVPVFRYQNLPYFPDQLYRGSKRRRLPKTILARNGVDAQVAFYENPDLEIESLTKLLPPESWTVVFHELAEAYAKIDGKDYFYAKGHLEACKRELVLRDQRPYLKDHNPGSGGAGDYKTDKVIIRK